MLIPPNNLARKMRKKCDNYDPIFIPNRRRRIGRVWWKRGLYFWGGLVDPKY